MHTPDQASFNKKKEKNGILNIGKNIEIIYKINNLLIERKLFFPEQRILIAVSGGQDSMLLLILLYRLRITWNWELAMMHFDHKWDTISVFQAKQIYRISYSMKLKYYLSIPVNIVKTEEQARNWRYTVMSRICNTHNYSSITTGHTASDQIETLLYNSIRGTGLDGLQSLSWKRVLQNKASIDKKVFRKSKTNLSGNIYLYWFYHKVKFTNLYLKLELVRPLLNTTRKQIQEQTDQWNIPRYSDPTNRLMNIRRNRIRHELLPYLRKYFNPKIDNVLSNLAEIVYSDLFYLETIVLSIYNRNNIINNSYISKSSSSIHIKSIKSYPIAIQRRILKKFFDSYAEKTLSFKNIEQIRFIILNSSSHKRVKHIILSSKVQVWIINNEMFINAMHKS
jgi:tRNA(Ile)-lysidine synthase